jgi:hypothetical protein
MSATNVGVTNRNKIKELLQFHLGAHSVWNELADDTKATYIRRIERGCYNNAVETCARDGIVQQWSCQKFLLRYSTNCYKVISNLEYEPLVIKIASDALEGGLDSLCLLPSHELDPRKSQKERDEIELRRNQKVVKKVSRAFKCRKCGKNKTELLSFQARAADEDSSISIKCIKCGHVWRR